MVESTPARRRARRPARAGGALSALRHRQFRTFWVGMALAHAGFDVQRVGLGFLAYDLTGSAFLLALVFAGDSLPMILLSPIGGVVSDRVDRRYLLMISRSIVAALALAVALLTAVGVVAVWQLFLYALLTGACYAFDVPARQGIIRALVPDEDLVNAVALTATLRQASRIVGPAIGGVALVVVGAEGALALMALGQLGLVVTAGLLALPHTAPPRGQSAIANLVEGLRFIARNEAVCVLLVVSALPALSVMAYQSLTPVFAQDVLGRGRAAIGVMLSAAGAGALIGSLLVATYPARLGRPVVAPVAAVAFGALVLLFSLSRSYPLSLALLVATGVANAVAMVVTTTAIQHRTPPGMQGRVMGVYQVTWELQFLGALAVGALADAAGAPAALAAAGLFNTLAIGLAYVLRPGIRRA